LTKPEGPVENITDREWKGPGLSSTPSMGLLSVASVHNASFEFVLTRLSGCDPVLSECGPHINWLTCVWVLALTQFMHLGLNWRALCGPTRWNQTSL